MPQTRESLSSRTNRRFLEGSSSGASSFGSASVGGVGSRVRLGAVDGGDLSVCSCLEGLDGLDGLDGFAFGAGLAFGVRFLAMHWRTMERMRWKVWRRAESHPILREKATQERSLPIPRVAATTNAVESRRKACKTREEPKGRELESIDEKHTTMRIELPMEWVWRRERANWLPADEFAAPPNRFYLSENADISTRRLPLTPKHSPDSCDGSNASSCSE